jgi:polar amino acid transport system substrate-binding protein
MKYAIRLSHLAIAIGLGIFAAGGVSAQEGASELSPITFTAPQAIGGGANYQRSCAACHGAELEGFSAPQLSGANFSWLDRPVSEFHGYIQDLMPADAPGSLSDAQVSTIIAFIAQSNGMQAGDVALPTDPAELETMRFGQ